MTGRRRADTFAFRQERSHNAPDPRDPLGYMRPSPGAAVKVRAILRAGRRSRAHPSRRNHARSPARTIPSSRACRRSATAFCGWARAGSWSELGRTATPRSDRATAAASAGLSSHANAQMVGCTSALAQRSEKSGSRTSRPRGHDSLQRQAVTMAGASSVTPESGSGTRGVVV